MENNAVDFSDFDFAAATRRVINENRREKEELDALRIKAREVGVELARELVSADPRIRQIWGFGSAFEDDRPFTRNSDIDLAIEGGNILRLFGIAENADFPVDLIDITAQADAFALLIRENGRLLYPLEGVVEK